MFQRSFDGSGKYESEPFVRFATKKTFPTTVVIVVCVVVAVLVILIVAVVIICRYKRKGKCDKKDCYRINFNTEAAFLNFKKEAEDLCNGFSCCISKAHILKDHID